MITKTDAINIGKALLAAADREKDNNNQAQEARYIINGVSHYALQNLWYDVFPMKTREQFGHDCQNFINQVWK